MSGATMRHAALVDALKELNDRLREFGLDKHWYAVFAAIDFLGRPILTTSVSVPIMVCCLRALAIEWPEEADTLHAAALACEAMQQEAC